MAWDPTQPEDTTKLRNLGVVIRPNWAAIVGGDSTFKPQALNYANRTVAGVPVDPTAVADTYITYAKTDAAGNTEMFAIDEDSNVIQLTKGVPIADTYSSTCLPGGLIMKTAITSAIVTGSTVTFQTAGGVLDPFPNNCFSVVVTPIAATGRFAAVSAVSVNSFKINHNTSAIQWYYIAIGN